MDNNRYLSLFRALPLETLNANWLTEAAGSPTHGKKQLRPGQLGPAAVDQFGIQYTRLVGGSTFPLTLDVLLVDSSAAIDPSNGLVTAGLTYARDRTSGNWLPVDGIGVDTNATINPINGIVTADLTYGRDTVAGTWRPVSATAVDANTAIDPTNGLVTATLTYGRDIDLNNWIPVSAQTLSGIIKATSSGLANGACQYGYITVDGVWGQINAQVLNGNIVNTSTGLVQGACQYGYVPGFNTWAPLNAVAWGVATQVQTDIICASVNSASYLHDGSTTNVAAIAADQSNSAPGVITRGVQVTTKPVNWSIQNAGGAGVQSTVTRAAGAAGERHVCMNITASFYAVAAVAASIELYLRDGTTGAGAILHRQRVNVIGSLANNQVNVNLSDLNIAGSVATAMTLEFNGAGVGAFQSVTLGGYTIPA